MQDQRQIIEDEIDLVELFLKLWKYKLFIATITVFSVVIAVISVHLLQPKYRVAATVIPNNKEFFKVYLQDLQASVTSSDMKIIVGDIKLKQYTDAINAFFLSNTIAANALSSISAFDSSKYKTIDEQATGEFAISAKTKDEVTSIEIIHPSPEIALKFTNALIEQVNKKLNENLSPGKNAQYLIVTNSPALPSIPHQPKKTLIVAVSAISSFFVSIFLVFFIEWVREVRKQIAQVKTEKKI